MGVDVLGSKYNANYTVLHVGGTGDPAAPFPRFPRWSVRQQTIIPSIMQCFRQAFLLVYPDARHDDTRYFVNENCRNVYRTWYRSAKVASGYGYGTGRNSVQGPHNPNPLTWLVHPRGISEPVDAYTTFRSVLKPGGFEPHPARPGWIPSIPNMEPLVWNDGGTVRLEARDSGPTLPWLTLNEDDLTTIYNVLGDDLGGTMPVAGVKHTLILYLYSWRSPYKQLTWDNISFPAWWTPGIPDAYGDITGYESWKNHEGQLWAAAAAAGYASEPTTDADNRLILLAAHITCLKLNAYIVEVRDHTDSLIPNPAPLFSTYGGRWDPGSTITIGPAVTAIRLSVHSMTKQATGIRPTTSSPWIHPGLPIATCYSQSYTVTITFDPYSGPQTGTIHFGPEVQYTIQRT